MRSLYFTLLLCCNICTAQTILLKDCENNSVVSNALVFDTDNNLIGTTNESGKIDISNIDKIKVNHPKYGSKTIIVEDVICIEETTLKEVIIESGETVKSELIIYLNNSRNKVKELKEMYYNVENTVSWQNNKVESYKGVVKYIFSKNSSNNSLYNHDIFLNPISKEIKDYHLVESFKFYDYYLPNYTIFNNKKSYNLLVSRINNSIVTKVGNTFFIFIEDSFNEYISFEVNEDKLISRYTNTSMEWSDKKYHKNRKLIYSYSDIVYDFSNIQKFQTINIKESMLINNQIINIHFKGDVYNGSRSILKNEKKGIGFVLMYMKIYSNI